MLIVKILAYEKKVILFLGVMIVFSTNILAQCAQCDGLASHTGLNASTLGTSTNAAGNSALASGYNASASGDYSTAIGKDIAVTANNSFVIGNGYSSNATLTNNISKSIMFGVNSSTPSLTIRQKTTQDAAAYVGIGTTNPMKEFHVNGDVMISGSNKALLFASSSASTNGNFGIKLTNDGLDFFVPDSGMPTENSIDNLLYIKNDGNVGIGTSLPKQMLHVVGGNILISRVANRNDKAPGSTNGSILFGDITSTQYPYGAWGIEYVNDNDEGHGLNFWKTQDANNNTINHVLFLCEESNYKGNVGIGTSKPKHKLSVNGTIQAKELIVTTLASDWPDFVFDPEYKLTNLHELGKYIEREKHLPGVPSTNKIGEEGIKVGEMNAILLQKVEELTLYVIELQKQIDKLKTDKQ